MNSSAIIWISAFGCFAAWFSVCVTWMNVKGKLERKYGVGIRTRATLATDAAWIAGHKAALPGEAVGCVAITAATIFAISTAGSNGNWPMWLVVAMFIANKIFVLVSASLAAAKVQK